MNLVVRKGKKNGRNRPADHDLRDETHHDCIKTASEGWPPLTGSANECLV